MKAQIFSQLKLQILLVFVSCILIIFYLNPNTVYAQTTSGLNASHPVIDHAWEHIDRMNASENSNEIISLK